MAAAGDYTSWSGYLECDHETDLNANIKPVS